MAVRVMLAVGFLLVGYGLGRLFDLLAGIADVIWHVSLLAK